MKLRPAQQTFVSGELSPKLRSRPDLKAYQQGAELLENFVTSPYGSLVKRAGTEYIDTVSDTLVYGRTFTFRVDGTNTFVVVVTEDLISIYNKTQAELLVGGNLLSNPSFDTGSSFWNTNLLTAGPAANIIAAAISFPGGSCTINSGNAADLDIDFGGDPEQVINVNPSSAELTQEVTGANPGNIHSLTLAVNAFSASGIITDYLAIGTTEGASDIVFTVDPMNSNKVTFTPPGTAFWINYRLDWDDAIDLTVGGELAPGEPGHIGGSASISLDSYTLVDTESLGGEDVVDFPSPYTEDQIRELQVEKAPGQSIMYFAVRATFTTKKLIRDVSGNWSFVDVTFVGSAGDPPEEWIATGYPGCITFFQGRLWLAGSEGKPTTVWGSVAGEDNYEDFSIGGAADDDALELPLARDGVIQWIQSGKALHVGTDGAEHIVTGESTEALLVPSNARSFQQSSYGSTRIHGKWLSEKISYVSNDRRRIYVGDYNRETLGFMSDELSYIAEHITFPGIVETAYAQNPRAHIWCVRADGAVIGATYQREAEAVGWHRHKTNFGTIQSMTITEEFGTSIVWLLINRQNKLYLEKTGGQHFDSFITREYSAPQVIVDGLDHLEGLVVQVIGDGGYAGEHSVLSGQVTVQNEASTFTVGIPYTAKLETLPLDTSTQTGMLTAKLRRWSRIYVRLVNSIPPIINGVRPPTRTAPTLMDTREANKTEDLSVATSGFDRNAKIIVEQDLPFRCEIVGIYGELSEDGF